MRYIKTGIAFLAGLITGSAFTYFYNKEKNKAEVIKEVNEYRRVILNTSEGQAKQAAIEKQANDILENTERGETIKPKETERDKTKSDNPDIFKSKDIEEYISYVSMYDEQNPGESTKKSKLDPDESVPYSLDPTYYGSIPEHETIHLSYYLDEVLADDDGEIIDASDYPNTVGSDFMKHFGDYANDTVWIRNIEQKTDYEIDRENEHYYDGESREYGGI